MFLTRTRQVVGLDIGSHAVKMVVLRQAKGDLPFELVHFGVAELPDESIVEGAVAMPSAVAQSVSALLDQHKVRAKHVAVSVSGNAVIVRRLSMSRRSPDEFRESLPWEAEEHIPFDIEEVDLDFAILEEDEEQDLMEVVLVAAKRDRVDEYVEVVEKANRRATIMDIDAFAVQNAFEYAYPERQFEDVAILNLGASIVNVAVVEGGKPAFWRDIAVGMRLYTQALQRQFMLDAVDAEDLLRQVSRAEAERLAGVDSDDRGLAEFAADDEEGADLQDAARDPRVREVIAQVSDRVAGEIKKTFDFYASQSGSEHFDAVFLAGGGAHITDLARKLEERMGWPVERMDPLRRVEVPEDAFDSEYVWQNGPESAVALGLALRGVTE